MIFDPFYLLVIGIGMALSLYASSTTKSRFRKYSQYTTRSRLTGAEVAQGILRDNNINELESRKFGVNLRITMILVLKPSVLANPYMIRIVWLPLASLPTRLVMQSSMQNPMACFLSFSMGSGCKLGWWVIDDCNLLGVFHGWSSIRNRCFLIMAWSFAFWMHNSFYTSNSAC